MSATLELRRPVTEHAAWRGVDDSLDPLRAEHPCTGALGMVPSDDRDDVVPRIEIVTSA